MDELVTNKTTKRTKGGGPKSKQGKAKSALNSVRHGIQAKSVLPAELEAYRIHQEAVMASLEPEGYLEERLAERVSLTLWRLTRLETWEAAVLTQRHRNAWETALYRRDGLMQLIDSLNDSASLSLRQVHSLTLQETFQELKRLAYGNPDELLRDWSDTASWAYTLIRDGDTLEAFYSPEAGNAEVTDQTLLALSPEAFTELARALSETLEMWEIGAETICREVLGERYTEEQVKSYKNGEWEWERAELPELWQLYTEEYARRDDTVNAPHLIAYRVGAQMKRNGERILELGERAKMLLTEQQAHAVMLSDSDLQMLQRYEAHLERVLYRAMHELEAMKDKRSGNQAPLARLEVHGGDV